MRISTAQVKATMGVSIMSWMKGEGWEAIFPVRGVGGMLARWVGLSWTS